MFPETFSELGEEVFRLHHAAAYDAALELLEQVALKFPDYAIRIDYWRMCFHALQGETAQALAVFQALLNRDDWIGESLLRHDPDLVSLQGNPDFQRLVGIAEHKRSQAQLHVAPKHYVVAPEATSAAPLLLVLHGNHDDAERHIRHWRSLVEAGWLLLVPQSSSIGAERMRFVWPDQDQQAFDEILRHVEEVQQKHALDLARTVIAGFSRGAGLAAKLALSRQLPALGFIAIAPGFQGTNEEWQPYLTQGQKNQVRGVVVVGKNDVVYEQTIGFIPRLHQTDIPVEVFEVPDMGHDYPANFGGIRSAALKFITSQK